jgi:hypothetical protein
MTETGRTPKVSTNGEEIACLLRDQNRKLQDILEHGSLNFRRYRRRAMVGFLVLVAASTLEGFWLWQQSQAIQTERARSIRAGCVEQNERNRNTIRQLDIGLAQARVSAGPAQVARIKRSRDFTVSLVDALVPVRDCGALVDRSVNTK